MKIKAKKGLALVLSLLMIISLLSVVIFNVTADPSGEPQSNELRFEKSANAVVNNNGTDVSISGDAGEWASKTLEIGAQPSISFKPVLTANNAAYLAITPDPITTGGILDYADAKGLIFKFYLAENNELKVDFYNSAKQWVNCGKIANYNNGLITLKWQLVGYHYELMLNGVAQGVNISERLYELDDEDTFTFFGVDSAFLFESVALVSGVGDSFTTMTNGDKLTISGDSTTGYSFTPAADIGSSNLTVSTYNKAVDFESTKFTIKLPNVKGQKINKNYAFVFSTSPSVKGYTDYTTFNPPREGDTPTGDTVAIGIARFYGSETNQGIYLRKRGLDFNFLAIQDSSNSFDYDAVHEVAFVKDDNGNWCLFFDGQNRTAANTYFTDYVNNMLGKKVYVSVITQGVSEFSDFNIISGDNVVISNSTAVSYTYGENGATTTGLPMNTYVNLLAPIDINTQGFQYKLDYSSGTTTYPEWYQTVALTKSHTVPAAIQGNDYNETDPTKNGLFIRFTYSAKKNYTNVAIVRDKDDEKGLNYYRRADDVLKYTDTFVFKFEKVDGNWTFTINDDPGYLPGGTDETWVADAQAYINTVLDELAKGDAYLHVGQFNRAYQFSNVKRVDIPDESAGEGFGTLPSNVTWGKAEDGSFWLNSGDVNFATANSFVLKGGINPSSQGFKIKFPQPTSDKWATFILNDNFGVDSTAVVTADDAKNNTIRFIVKNVATGGARFSLYHYGLNEVHYGNIPDFDWNKVHTINFIKNSVGVWQLYIDGKLPSELQTATYPGTDKSYHEFVDDTISPILDNLVEKGAFLRFGANGVKGEISNIKVINTLTSNDTIKDAKTDAGVTITDTVNDGKATLTQSINLLSQYINFKQHQFGEYSQFTFSTNHVPYADFNQGKEAETANNIVNIRLVKDGTKAIFKCSYYGAGNTVTEETIGTIQGFNFSVAHTLGFIKNNGNWLVAVDDKIENFTYSNALQSHLNNAVNNLVKGNVYVQFGTKGGKLAFSKIAIVDLLNLPHERTNFYYTVNEYAIGGNSTIGYAISNTTQNCFVGFKDVIDFNTQSIYAKFNVDIDKTAFLGFSNTYENIAGYPDDNQERDYNAIGLLFKKKNTDTAVVSAYYDGAEHIIGEAEFDWTIPHWFGFTKADDKWKLMVDGLYLFDVSETAASVFEELGSKITEFATKGKAYAIFGSVDAPINLENVKVMNNTDIVVPEIKPFRLDSGINYSGQLVGGYSLNGSVNNVVAGYKSEIDFNTQSIRLQVTVPNGAMAHLGFSKTYAKISYQPEQDEEEKYSIISLFLKKTADKELTISAYFSGAEYIMGKVSDFDWTLAHTYGFTKVEDEWEFAVDGVVLTDKGIDYVTVMEHISDFIDIHATSKKAFAQLATIGGLANFSRIRVVQNEYISEPEASPFNLHETMVYDGNIKEGYTVVGSKANKLAAYKNPIDIDGQTVFTKINMPAGNWGVIYFSTSDQPFAECINTVENETNHNAVALLFRRQAKYESRIDFSIVYRDSQTNKVTEVLIGYSNSVNWNAAHAIGLSCINGKWAVYFDGRQLDSVLNSAKTAFEHATPFLENLKNAENVYVQLGMFSAVPNFSRFNIVDNSKVDDLVMKEFEDTEVDTDVGDWDDSWDLEESEYDDDEDWEFTFGEDDEDGFFDFEDEIIEDVLIPEPEEEEDSDEGKGTSYKKVTYITKEIPGLTTLQIILIIVGGVVVVGAAVTTTIIILVKRKKKKAVK